MRQQAQASLQRSIQAMQAMQNAQAAARKTAASGANNLGTSAHPLPNVPDGLTIGGLVPGTTGVDAANPSANAVAVPITVNANGSASFNLGANSAVTLPTSLAGSGSITVSGTGTVGTITTGNVITPITAGTAVLVAPGSTISLSKAETITVAGATAGAVPTAITTYNYGTSAAPAAVPASWVGVGGMSQATYAANNGQATGQTAVTLTQTSSQALLNWQTFNVGKNTVLDFDQSQGGADVGQWVAINKVAANIAPSQVLGTIEAPGQVYVVNQNGIIFGGSSQINMGALVASSLPINDNLVSRGLLDNPDLQFLFSQNDIPAGANGPTPAFQPQENTPAPTQGLVAKADSSGNVTVNSAAGSDGDVIVQAGAQLNSPANAESVGGRIALVGPNVSNQGTIATPDGQTILAAGNQVGFVAHDSNDPTLRGLDVYIGAVDSSSGSAINSGLIDSPEADITMAGKNVVQNGVMASATSVSLNGRIDLLADYNSVVTDVLGTTTALITPSSTDGTVTLGANSVTQILPELSSTDTVVGTQLALSSIVNVQGGSIALNQNALLWAPSAALPSAEATQPTLGLTGVALPSGVTLNAGSWLQPLGQSAYSFFTTSGQINLAGSSSIDVSGSQDVSASVLEDIVAAQLLGTELANSPVQRNGPLRGQTVDVNLLDTGVSSDGTAWIGTPLADISGYINLVQHDVGELTTNGGTVSLNAGQAVNLQAGSTINVSGGWTDYAGANVTTTKVVADGQVIDISQADPDVVYSGVYTGFTEQSAKWGITQTYANALLKNSNFMSGYIQGGSGGSLSITAPTMTVSGNLYGNTVAGANQRTSAASLERTYAGASFLPTVLATQAIPQAGTLNLNFQSDKADPATGFPAYSPTPPRIDFGTSQAAGDLVLSPNLVSADGFSNLSINNSDGSIYVPADVSLSASSGGSISFAAANIDVEGQISAPGGNLSFTTYDISPYIQGLLSTPPVDPTRGNFTLGANASLSVAGLDVDDRSTSSTAETLPLVTSGGSVSIDSFNADLATGSGINASGGIDVTAANKVSYGAGGSISVLAGEDVTYNSVVGGNLILGATLQGLSGSKGGSLTLQGSLVQVGGIAADPANTLLLAPSFFSQGGFSKFTIDALGEADPSDPSQFLPAVSIASGTVIDPVVQQWVANLNSAELTMNAETLPFASERTPVSLAFNAEGVKNFAGPLIVPGNFVMGAGSSIKTDPGASVSISGTTADILGRIIVPGGTISVSGAKDSTSIPGTNDLTDPLVTVDLGSSSYLSTAGAVEMTPNAYGYTTGTVLAGGKISIAGNILAETGSTLDVSGTSAVLDVTPTQAGSTGYQLTSPALVPERIDSNGGSISLTGDQLLYSNATLLGAAGGSSAQGGSLSISTGEFVSPNASSATPLDVTLRITQNAETYSSSGIDGVVTLNGGALDHGDLAVSSFSSGGFDNLTLAGTVQFSGPVTISTNRGITVGAAGNSSSDSGGIIYADSTVNLDAPYVDLGLAFQAPLSPSQENLPVYLNAISSQQIDVSPVYGSGVLNVNAGNLVDVGNLSLQNIGALNLNVAGGDVRGDGTLDVAGRIAITAGQIYPTTETSFTIAAYDYNGLAGNGTITIAGSGLPQLPLSAGGTLNVFASNITDGGVLRAPLGTINLGDGVTGAAPTDVLSGSAFPTTQNLTLTSGSITSVSAVDPTTGQDLTLPYGTLLNGVSWIDPAGNNITTAGNGADAIPNKVVNVSGVNVNDEKGATIDISGGGDLYAYNFVSGTNGTQDVLASNSSYAIVPSYSAKYAPYYSSSDYNNPNLAVGSQIYLNGSSGLPTGVYTLLPARYALLPGAFLVTPVGGTVPSTALAKADGSTLVSGYIFNGLDQSQATAPLLSSFEVASQTVVKNRAEYDGYSGDTFLGQSAAAQGTSVLLPIDAGQLVLAATNSLSLQGAVSSAVPTGGLGSQVDIASPSNILVSGPNTDLSDVGAGTLVLDSTDLSAFGADSLLVGGFRTSTPEGAQVTVTTNNLTVDNSGASLSGPDVILASNDQLTVKSGSTIEQTGQLGSAAENLLLGNAAVAGSGDGVLLRVSSDTSAQVLRSGVATQAVQAALPSAQQPDLAIGSGVTISGNGLTLDSTYATSLDSTSVTSKAFSVSSGQISLDLDNNSAATGLVFSSGTLASLQASTQALSLRSYSSIDIYENGTGSIGAVADSLGKFQVASFTLDAGAIRGFDGGTVTINAQNVALQNSTGGSSTASSSASGQLVINSSSIQLGGGAGASTVNLSGYADADFSATNGVLVARTLSTAEDSSGNPIVGTAALNIAGNLQITAPLIAGATGANMSINATGAVDVLSSVSGPSDVTGGLGGTFTITGSSVTENSAIRFASGDLTLQANGLGGSVDLAGTLDVSGEAETFNDLTEYTSGGQIKVGASSGNVSFDAGSSVSVAANSGGGNAGTLTVSAPTGTFTPAGTLLGQGGKSGQGGSFALDIATVPGGSVQSLDTELNGAGFNQSIAIVDRTDSAVTVAGTVRAANYALSANQGSITVTGTIDASNVAALDPNGKAIQVGGSINLEAAGSVTLASGGKLTVAAQNFSNAGQGGLITLAAGSETNGNEPSTGTSRQGDGTFAAGVPVVNIEGNSTIDLSVAANNGSSAAAGDFTGTLHLRAPQTADGSDVQIDPIAGTILNASNVIVEGYKLYAPAGGSIDSVEGSASASTAFDGTVYGDAEGFAANTPVILASLLSGTPNAGNSSTFQVTPGAEIISTTGDLTLAGDWDLSSFRFGPNNVAGVLTVRSAGNLILQGSLSDGFMSPAYNATLLAANTALPANDQSWSYNLVAGADLSAASLDQVVPAAETYDPATGLAVAGSSAGSLELGNLVTANDGNPTSAGTHGSTGAALSGYYQVIRTGSGNINIAAAGDVLLQNQFATIYTVGTQAPALANFQTPVLKIGNTTYYPAQYSYAGGNVSVFAGGNIAHVTENTSGALVLDSEKELPNNWLYRRGYVVTDSGQFGATKNGDIASTSWWIDFSNYFEGVGALGGGNVSLQAEHDVSNVDAVAPTNARTTYQAASGDTLAADQTVTELGGGNVAVIAGNDINAGAYYVERGQGSLAAGGSIVTNYTRSPSLGTITLPAVVDDSATWLPTTLFLGDGSFSVTAQDSLLLGPVANPFLLPQAVNNTYWDKTYFSTYASTDAVNATSLTGDVVLRQSATFNGTTATPLLQIWLQNVDLLSTTPASVSNYQPWLNITETSVVPFSLIDSILPPTLRIEALSGDIDTVGNLTLAPSPIAALDLIAEGSINGLQPTGTSDNFENGTPGLEAWTSSEINVSDANPAAIPGVLSPFAYEALVGTSPVANNTNGGFITVNGVRTAVKLDFSFIKDLFDESGSTEGTYGVLQTKLQLHAAIDGQTLHANDPNLVHLYAANGNISGLTLFSGQATRVVAGQDITDIALYLQNNNANDVSVVAAGRDIVAYDASSPLLEAAQAAGNVLDIDQGALAGDIQISGPGTLEVLAGRNLNLGVGQNNSDGTGVGMTSIGNERNPTLPFGGADVFAAAGIGASSGFDLSKLDFTDASHTGFIDLFLNPATGTDEASTYLPDLGSLMGLTGDSNQQVWTAFNQLPPQQQDTLALDVFYLVLRDSGRAHNNPVTPTAGNYAGGYAAIAALFPDQGAWQGDVSLTSREIKTTNGGNISILAPGGQLNVGLNVNGVQAVDQGILTEDGGNISIFADGNVNVGTSRIFTLNGGNEIIWSTNGNIDAGASSKTVQSAPPTRVLIDPQSGEVETDLAGLATGGGIGVLATRQYSTPSDVDLIAPHGIVNAGDAGIRASGNLNIAAVQVLNASNIQVGGKSSGVPTTPTSNVAGLAAASSAAGGVQNSENAITQQAQQQNNSANASEMPSLVTVEVLGYGGGEDD